MREVTTTDIFVGRQYALGNVNGNGLGGILGGEQLQAAFPMNEAI